MVLGAVSRLVTRRLVPKQNGGVINKKRDYFGGNSFDPDERPGRNMPLTIKNRGTFTLVYSIFWFTGVGLPFYCVYYHMTKG
uniref:Uncharacterized protein n=1 Tax=Pinctada fucata TaxID=50426 RepID=A0A194ALI3_PINFU